MEYFVPKIVQILSSCNDLKGPSRTTEGMQQQVPASSVFKV